MRPVFVRALILTTILGLAACDDDPTVVADSTLVRVEGAVTEFVQLADPLPVPGTWVAMNLLTADGEGVWSTDSTDAAGQYALALEAPIVCEEGDSLPTQVRVEARDFATHTRGTLAGDFRLACDTVVQTLDVSLNRTVYRTPRAAGSLTGSGVSAAYGHACAVSGDDAYCWGNGGFGQLGSEGYTGQHLNPVRVAGGHAFVQVATGREHTCGLDADSLAWCWGWNGYGGVGIDTTTLVAYEPVAVTGGRTLVDVIAGRWHGCGLEAGGDVYCWGSGSGVGAGLQPFDITTTPVRVQLDGAAVRISSEFSHSCALMDTGDLWCWGFSYAGELGSGETQGHYVTPVQVTGSHEWAAVDAGSVATCALTTEGTPYCWGRDLYGQLGLGEDVFDVGTPQPVVDGPLFTAISIGGTHACGLTDDGTAYCWGDNEHGALGVPFEDGDPCEYTPSCVTTPTPVETELRFIAIDAGDGYTCAITIDDALVCWGLRDRLGAG